MNATKHTDDESTLVQVMAWFVGQQAITCASIDPELCRHTVSLLVIMIACLMHDIPLYCILHSFE